MKLKNKTYDFWKKMLQEVIPALLTCVVAILVAFGYSEVAGIITIVVSAIATCIGKILGISTKNYYSEQE